MQESCALAIYSVNTLQAHLRFIWHVDADSSYSVLKPYDPTATSWVAIRTLHGLGSLRCFSGQAYSLPAGTVLFLPLHSIAAYRAAQEGWHFYWFQFELLAGQITYAEQVLELVPDSQEMVLLERCFSSLKSAKTYTASVAHSLFNYLAADWLEQYFRRREEKHLFRQVTDILDRHQYHPASVSAMAREAGICERKFRDTVREATGMSPKEYMIQKKMTAALELLRTTDLTVSDIALRLQYANPFYFSSAFKNYYGISPQKMRLQIQW